MIAKPTIESTRRLIQFTMANKLDKLKRPVAEHCYRVAEALPFTSPKEDVMAALLHDIVEDEVMSLYELYRDGYPLRTIALVSALTRSKDTTYASYIQDIKATRDTGLIMIKIADIADNRSRLSLLSEKDAGDLGRRYERAEATLHGALGMAKRVDL